MLIYIMLIRSAIFPFVPSPSDRVNQGDWDADRIRGKNVRLNSPHLIREEVCFLTILVLRNRALCDSLSWCFLWDGFAEIDFNFLDPDLERFWGNPVLWLVMM